MGDAPLTTQQKALALNLDPATYGVFAEIGHPRPDTVRWCIDRHGDFTTGHPSLLASLLAGDEPYAKTVALRFIT